MYLAILLFLIVTFIAIPIIRQKYSEHKELKKEAEARGLKTIPKKKKISDRNGTQQDLSEFISRLVTFARRNKVRTIIPATFTYNGEVARISAILIGHGRVLGIFCMGYGGSIEPDLNRDEWRQELNGQVKYFKNPLKITAGMDTLVKTAMTDEGLDVPFKTVCVFTTPNVDISPVIQDIYTDDAFFYYLNSSNWVREGDLDMSVVYDTILRFVPMDEIKQAQKEREQQIKEQQQQAKAGEKEAKKEARQAKKEDDGG